MPGALLLHGIVLCFCAAIENPLLHLILYVATPKLPEESCGLHELGSLLGICWCVEKASHTQDPSAPPLRTLFVCFHPHLFPLLLILPAGKENMGDDCDGCCY